MLILLLVFIVGVVCYVFLVRRRRGSTSSSQQVGRLHGTGKYEFDIVGELQYQSALESICGGRTEEGAQKHAEAHLYLEDANPYDNKAVRVDIDGMTVGYLSRENARSYREQLTQLGLPNLIGVCNALIVGGWRRSSSDEGYFGVKLDLPVK